MFENLDTQDREICKALVRGVSNEEIKAQFWVGDDKISQLRPIATNVSEKEEEKVDTEINDAGNGEMSVESNTEKTETVDETNPTTEQIA